MKRRKFLQYVGMGMLFPLFPTVAQEQKYTYIGKTHVQTFVHEIAPPRIGDTWVDHTTGSLYVYSGTIEPTWVYTGHLN